MKKWLPLLFVLLMLTSCALADENHPDPIPADQLPHVEKVTFPEIAFTAPDNGKDNPVPDDACLSEDGMHYHDDSIDVRVHMIRVYDTPVSVAFVQIADADQFRTQLAKPFPSKTTVRISVIAKQVHSVFAVNGDWFTYEMDGIIYRNGKKLLVDPHPDVDALVVDTEGDLHIVRPATVEAFEELPFEIMHSFSFGPALVRDGEVLEIENRAITYKQRNAIGQIDKLTYVFIAADGPDQPNSVGLSVPQLAQLMYGLGAKTAYNLDGGQSTSMFMYKTKVNGQAPETMRAIGDIIYFCTAIEK